MSPSLARLTLGFFVLAAVFGLAERLWPAKAGQRLLREGWGLDLAYWFFTPLVTKAVTRAAVILAVVCLALAAGVELRRESVLAFLDRPSAAKLQPRWLQVLEVLVIGDFLGYWMHRAFHGGALWRFHAVHHASTELDWLSATRLHPVNDVVHRLAQVVPFVVLGFDLKVLGGYAPFLAFYAIGLHANVPWDFGPLRGVIGSPVFHRWHHTAQSEGLDKNFAGLLPLWDRLFGTYYMPEGRLPEAFGVGGERVPTTLWGQLAYPFTSRGAA